jgi:hypothetical protein
VVGGTGVPALFAADLGHLVTAELGGVQTRQGLLQGDIHVRQKGLLTARVPDGPGELPGVHALDGGDAVVLQNFREGLGVAEVAGDVVVLPDHQPADGGDLGLVVLVGDAVVADDGIGHHHQLPGVGRVGDDLLIAHHGGVEHQLAHPVPSGPEAAAQVLASVGQHDLAV